MQQIPFTSIKILKSGVTIVPMPIEDTNDNNWKLGAIDTDKPASDAMLEAMASFIPEVRKRLEIVPVKDLLDETIAVHGVTIGYKNGYVGISIHFRIDNTWFTGTHNSHLPFIYEYAGDLESLEDPDEAKPFLTEEMILNLEILSEATQEYMKVKPKDLQLSLFGGTNGVNQQTLPLEENTPEDSFEETQDFDQDTAE